MEFKPDKIVEVSDVIVLGLGDYADVMLLKLLKKLSPRSLMDHQIKLQYLKRYLGKNTLFKQSSRLVQEAYIDVDYAGFVVDRRSTTI